MRDTSKNQDVKDPTAEELALIIKLLGSDYVKTVGVENIKKWFTLGEIGGQRVVKVIPGSFTPPIVQGPAIFHGKVTTYEMKERPSLVFEEDF